jgi:hypothetical protein
MTIEIARVAADSVLASTIIWQLQRVLRRLSEKQREVDALREMVSYLMLTQGNYEAEDTSLNSGLAQEAAPLRAPDAVPSGVRERRLVSRRQASRIGKIILHHGRPAGVCTISNVSPAGALLLLANAHGLPEQFDLDMDGYSRPCTARWRRPARIGVSFDSISAG